jgi:predicted outer membrane repeat protein
MKELLLALAIVEVIMSIVLSFTVLFSKTTSAKLGGALAFTQSVLLAAISFYARGLV